MGCIRVSGVVEVLDQLDLFGGAESMPEVVVVVPWWDDYADIRVVDGVAVARSEYTGLWKPVIFPESKLDEGKYPVVTQFWTGYGAEPAWVQDWKIGNGFGWGCKVKLREVLMEETKRVVGLTLLQKGELG